MSDRQQAAKRHYTQLFKTFRNAGVVLAEAALPSRTSTRRMTSARRQLASLIQSEQIERQSLRNALIVLQATRFRGAHGLAYADAILSAGTHEANLAVITAHIALVRTMIEHLESESDFEPVSYSPRVTDAANDRMRQDNGHVFLSQRFG